MKVIETTFRGCRFRSRFEARWAVFMHTLGVRYAYEPEAYDLGDDIYYLPDFWLPQQDCFLEIKPKFPTGDETEKAQRLCAFTKKRVLICFGPLGVPDYSDDSMIEISPLPVFRDEAKDDGETYWEEACGWDNAYSWCECPHCGRIGIHFNGRADRIPCNCAKSKHGDKGYNSESPRLVHAYETAQGFRFY